MVYQILFCMVFVARAVLQIAWLKHWIDMYIIRPIDRAHGDHASGLYPAAGRGSIKPHGEAKTGHFRLVRKWREEARRAKGL